MVMAPALVILHGHGDVDGEGPGLCKWPLDLGQLERKRGWSNPNARPYSYDIDDYMVMVMVMKHGHGHGHETWTW